MIKIKQAVIDEIRFYSIPSEDLAGNKRFVLAGVEVDVKCLAHDCSEFVLRDVGLSMEESDAIYKVMDSVAARLEDK